MLFERQIARKPDLYPWTRDFKRAMWHGFWTDEKFTFDSDKVDYALNMTDHERQMVLRCLAAIAQIEVKVKDYWGLIGRIFPHPSIAGVGAVFHGVEEIHNVAYERLIEELGLDHIFDEILNFPAIAGRVSYLSKHTEKTFENDRKQQIYSLVLFTMFVENVSLFSQFYIVLWLNRYKNLLKDAAQQVKYTRNEELLHAQFGMKIVNTLRVEYPELFDAELEAKIKEECQVAYEAECKLIDWMVGDYTGENMSADILKGYVQERLNESLNGIGYDGIFAISEEQKQATFWMTEGLLAPVKVDFFHSEPTSYQKADQSDDDNF